jgi:hypothetical protein
MQGQGGQPQAADDVNLAAENEMLRQQIAALKEQLKAERSAT